MTMMNGPENVGPHAPPGQGSCDDHFNAQAVLETLPVSVIMLDASGQPRCANAPARRLAGVVHADTEEGLRRLVADSPLFAAPDASRHDCEDRFECQVEGGRALAVTRQWRMAGDNGVFSVTLRPSRNEEAAPTAAAGSTPEDKPGRKHQSMIHAEKLATVGQLAAGMAHEINNPICYVQSNLGTLGDYLNKLFGIIELSDHLLRDTTLDSAQRLESFQMRKQSDDYQLIAEDLPALLEESREGVERIRQIVQNLRDFSRLDPTESFRLFDVHRAIETTLDIVRSLGGGRTRFTTYFDQLPLIECNPTELNQVFMNILVNATQAVEDNGAIEIHTGTIPGEEAVLIRISDNGCGMDETTRERIFEPFYTTKEVGKGTGLGLSISYGIIKKHGGRIEVDSVVGEGTTFSITLPLRQADTTMENRA
jgi:two-component system, NtrC family, sensor kinase